MKLATTPLTARAFTLIELVISSALMSVILVAAYVCLSASISGRKLVESRADVIQNARVAMNLLAADLRSACMLSREFEFLGMSRTIEETEADNLDFATHNYTPKGPHEGDFCEVSYYLNKDRKTGEFSLWRRRDPTLDPEPLAGGTKEEIARGLRGLKFEYYDGLYWYDEWGDPAGKRRGRQSTEQLASNMSGMPEAVRITLSFASEPPKKKTESVGTNEGSENQNKESPPLVLQTVVRLNLAPISNFSGSSSSSSGGTQNSTSPTTQAAPSGGGN